ncbi:ABC transporter ATP-binding protein [Candidatus Falkowbacteria bacterium]|nr:ABC transporter ATP-binding protein [Candidatus Falkowbacteria bacterium]
MARYSYQNFVDSKKFSWSNLIKAILFLFGRKKKAYILWLSFLIVLLFYDIVPPLLIGKTVDFFTNYTKGEPLTTFYWYAFLLGFLTAVVAFLRLSTKRGLANLRNEITYDIRVNGFEKLLSQSLLEHGQENTGSKEMKIQNGISSFKGLSGILDNRLLPALTSTVGIFAVFLLLKPAFILVLVVYLIGLFLIINYFNGRLFDLSDERNRAMEGSSGSYVEGLSNIMAIKSNGAEQHFKQSIAEKEELRKKFDQQIIILTNNQWKVFQIVNSAYIGLFLLMVGRGVAAGTITVGAIVIFFSYIQKLISGATQLMDVYGDVIDIKATIGRMMLIFWADNSDDDGNKPFPEWDSLKITKASFAYKKDGRHAAAKANIRKLDLEIKKFQKVGLVGTTGSGKSTLAKLLIGLYRIDKGDYSIGGVDFYSIKREEIFKHCAIVLQESEMFNVTLRENIALHGDFDQQLFDRAISIAQLGDVIAKLPNGVETTIGERGYHLSGGERQRIGIARAIYKDPEIIIFDEATSSLDMATEKKIQTALAKELKQKTIIIVAHRVNTLEDVDVIYRLQNGEIIESGSYKEFFGKK